MKDFLKWLGINEKIAKVVVWIFLIMIMLIIINMALDSLGFPHYQITHDNLKKIDSNKVLQYLINWVSIILNFFAIVLLIFSVKEFKKIFKYSLLYLVLNVACSLIFNRAITEIFVFAFIVIFCFFYSQKNYKYILYALISFIVNSVVQVIVYAYKVRLVDYDTLSEITKSLLFSDYFIIMGIIILVKEIYLKKRREKNGTKLAMDR